MGSSRFLFLAVFFTTAMGASAQDADKKTVDAILQEIDLVPSLYAKYQPAPAGNVKYLAEALTDYADRSAAQERKSFEADKKQYARDNPLRAALFETSKETQATLKNKMRLTLDRKLATPKAKALFLMEQTPIGIAIFKLEQQLQAMHDADKKRKEEKSKRWLANFDTAYARLQGNLIFLYEYNFTLGAIRADALPELRDGDTGWAIKFEPNIFVTESKAKNYRKEMVQRLKKIEETYAETPWGTIAERDRQRSLGMTWRAKK